MRFFERAITPDEPTTPNPNPEASVPPGTVGYGSTKVVPGDPHGVTVAATEPATTGPPPIIRASPWSGWPAEWYTPNWWGRVQQLTGIAWACVDLNASVLATMPPYIVNGASTLDTGWITNPDDSIYSSWEEFAKQLFWDYQATGEAFVYATAFYSTGWPARFRVLEPWLVNMEMTNGTRSYSIGEQPVSRRELLHLRYQSSTSDAHGHGPLEAGQTKLVAAEMLARYGAGLAQSGGIPTSVLIHPEQQSPEQAAQMKADWVQARISSLGEPAVLTGGVTWQPTQVNAKDMALIELLQFNDASIAVMLGVPPPLVGLPTAGESLTYNTVLMALEQHWRTGLRPKAATVMAGLSGWLLPRGTTVEVNKDAYVQPEPLVRAQTAEIYNRIKDETGQSAMTVAEIREAERLDDRTEDIVAAPVISP